MSLRRKVISRRKLKEPNKAEKKNLTDLIRRNRIFSGPCYKQPKCQKQKNVAEKGSLKWMWEGVTDTQMKQGWIRTKPGAPAEFK